MDSLPVMYIEDTYYLNYLKDPRFPVVYYDNEISPDILLQLSEHEQSIVHKIIQGDIPHLEFTTLSTLIILH